MALFNKNANRKDLLKSNLYNNEQKDKKRINRLNREKKDYYAKGISIIKGKSEILKLYLGDIVFLRVRHTSSDDEIISLEVIYLTITKETFRPNYFYQYALTIDNRWATWDRYEDFNISLFNKLDKCDLEHFEAKNNMLEKGIDNYIQKIQVNKEDGNTSGIYTTWD